MLKILSSIYISGSKKSILISIFGNKRLDSMFQVMWTYVELDSLILFILFYFIDQPQFSLHSLFPFPLLTSLLPWHTLLLQLHLDGVKPPMGINKTWHIKLKQDQTLPSPPHQGWTIPNSSKEPCDASGMVLVSLLGDHKRLNYGTVTQM